LKKVLESFPSTRVSDQRDSLPAADIILYGCKGTYSERLSSDVLFLDLDLNNLHPDYRPNFDRLCDNYKVKIVGKPPCDSPFYLGDASPDTRAKFLASTGLYVEGSTYCTGNVWLARLFGVSTVYLIENRRAEFGDEHLKRTQHLARKEGTYFTRVINILKDCGLNHKAKEVENHYESWFSGGFDCG
jgi:hypothetical protein